MVFVKNIYFSSDGTVNLNLSDKSVLKLDASVWDKLGRPREKYLTKKQLQILKRESLFLAIKNKMMILLALREHSSFELRTKINDRFFKSATCDLSILIDRCLLEMQERDFQSDERFTKHFIESKLSNKIQGPFKILQDLKNRGIPNELANKVLSEIVDQELWVGKALDFIEHVSKKSIILDSATLSKKLYQRGFSWDTICQALEEFKTISSQDHGAEFHIDFEDS